MARQGIQLPIVEDVQIGAEACLVLAPRGLSSSLEVVANRTGGFQDAAMHTIIMTHRRHRVLRLPVGDEPICQAEPCITVLEQDEQVAFGLRQAKTGTSEVGACRNLGISE